MYIYSIILIQVLFICIEFYRIVVFHFGLLVYSSNRLLVLRSKCALFLHFSVSLSVDTVVGTRFCFRFLLVGIVAIIVIAIGLWYPSRTLIRINIVVV